MRQWREHPGLRMTTHLLVEFPLCGCACACTDRHARVWPWPDHFRDGGSRVHSSDSSGGRASPANTCQDVERRDKPHDRFCAHPWSPGPVADEPSARLGGNDLQEGVGALRVHNTLKPQAALRDQLSIFRLRPFPAARPRHHGYIEFLGKMRLRSCRDDCLD